MIKNTGALVCSIIGAIFAVIGGIVWASCADVIGSIGNAVSGDSTGPTIYMIVFLVLGIGGGAIALIGGIRGYGGNSMATFLCALGTLMQVGNLIAQYIAMQSFSFMLSLSTLLAVVFLLVATILCAKNR